MFFVYDTRAPRKLYRAPKRPPDPTAMWVRHASARVYLMHVRRTATFEQRAQIEEELAVCEHKLSYWERKPGWDVRYAQLALVALRNQRN
jgi:hypothetical protein